MSLETSRIAAGQGAHPSAPSRRLAHVDIARTLAILGMVAFHLVYDLGLFGVLRPDIALTGFWALFARAVAGSFLFLTGVGLVLAHGGGLRWRAFIRRLATIAGAALLVTAGTWIAMPERFVYFGILHCIAASSLLALPFLRLPPIVPLVGALLVWAVAWHWGRGVFDAPWASFTGLSAVVRPSVDLVALFPWLAPCLLGVACAGWAARAGLLRREILPDTALVRLLGLPGRWSLPIYLLHQPVLVGGIFAVLWLLRG